MYGHWQSHLLPPYAPVVAQKSLGYCQHTVPAVQEKCISILQWIIRMFLSVQHKFTCAYMLCILYLFWSLIGQFFVLYPIFPLAGIGFVLQRQWHRVFTTTKAKSWMHRNTVCIWHCALCPHEICHSLLYMGSRSMAILCGWPGPCSVEGKGCRIWTDGGIGGMVCVVGMRGETAGSWAVGLFLFHPWAGGQSLDIEDERWWRERSRSQKRGRIQVKRHSKKVAGVGRN